MLAEHQDLVEVRGRDALRREATAGRARDAGWSGSGLEQPVARGKREVQHREIEPSGLWRRAFDRADEALRDELELAAHPDEAMRLVVFVLAQGAAEHVLDGIAEHTG